MSNRCGWEMGVALQSQLVWSDLCQCKYQSKVIVTPQLCVDPNCIAGTSGHRCGGQPLGLLKRLGSRI